MKSVISGNSVLSIIRNRLKPSSSLLKDIGQILEFGAFILSGEPISQLLAIGKIGKTAGSSISLASNIIGKFENKDHQVMPLLNFNYETFEVIYYVMCQRCYLKALKEYCETDNFLRWFSHHKNINERKISISDYERKKIEENVLSVQQAEVKYSLLQDPMSLEIPLYKLYSEWFVSLMQITEDKEKKRKKN